MQLHKVAQWVMGMMGEGKTDYEMPVYPELNMNVDKDVLENKKKQ